ncbi:hypothetical protein HNQ68_003165 [Pseudochrobactrum saccharolyticum]|uniref:DNA 3'-5' helicase II n=1 Tax=Pseudochrobactrum saccharolyticum TaxID=354352 RepID=A0A7W8ERG7_9HYPH|nr:NERD domain-containing protein/DEAD/DEAH box helicase [Pseudochrobactrum saccharolyticum]KAB0537053.1 AAA family ATPase [Pseudochrobactrum saccharolyticum]MBB5092608.1 hypothetical protein [Pseudochrobactrum saccharolyticum]
MAKMIPNEPVAGTPMSERVVHTALSRLDDNWIVIHSVRWQSLRNGRPGDGEADFILIHPKRGILIVEVKGGDINVIDGEWSSTNSKTGEVSKIKNPFDQATDSKYALLEYLKYHGLPTNRISLAHAVSFPRRTIDPQIYLGPAAPASIVWDRPELGDPVAMVERTCKHWAMSATITNEEIKKLVQLLAPTTSIRRRLVDRIDDIHQQLLRLTDEQIQDFTFLRSFRRALVTGGAGTGKTVLAVARARQLAADGFNPLLVCYNERLGDLLAKEISDDPRIWAGTFHSLCIRMAKERGKALPKQRSEEWWKEDAPKLLIDVMSEAGGRFGSVVIDEGQDFPSGWFTALELAVAEAVDPPFYVFADAHQQLYLDNWTSPSDMPPALPLTVNCRSTTAIASCAARVFGEEAIGRGTDGPPPQFRDINNRREMLRGIQRLTETLIEKEAVDANDIVVLSDDTDILEGLSHIAAGEVPFVREGVGVRMETIRRFKGLEAGVVVLALSERTSSKIAAAMAYTGMSRARSALYVFGSRVVRDRVSWLG